MQINHICRLCLEEKTNNETVLVEIFSAYVNQPGKAKLTEKILSLTGLSITKNDGLPLKICHKCVVSIDSFYDFKHRVLLSDEKLRQFLNINGTISHNEEESSIDESSIIRLDPNKVYESSDDEAIEGSGSFAETSFDSSKQTEQLQQQQEYLSAPSLSHQEKKTSMGVKKPCNASTREKIEIFHCKYCDVVFSEPSACTDHETHNHDQINPYECTLCTFKATQHQNLIIHIKSEHNTDKPFFCVVCSKNFIRRSDLRKHIFVHAGIRLFSCDICFKSFTRSQNLAKHKRTHFESNVKSFKCSLCPKAFASNGELSSHMEIHMNRNTLNCKYCNQVFTQRDELDVHQRSHIAQMKIAQAQELASTPIVFYNQNPAESQQQQSPMNFYKEHTEMPQQHPLPPPPPHIEHPIINSLLSNQFNSSMSKCDKCPEQFPTSLLLQNHLSMHHSKNFACLLCSNSYFKKKELDRHVITAHTDIKYNCSKCTKSFSRKDKLTRHEKTHLATPFFNCALCPAVFIRKHLLDLHSKIHTMPNNNNNNSGASRNNSLLPTDSGAFSMNFDQQPQVIQDILQPVENAFMSSYASPGKQPLDLSSFKISEEQQAAVLYPMNLSLSEPMDLSNDYAPVAKTEEPKPVKSDEDDENDDLKIIESNNDANVQENGVSELQPADEIVPKTEPEQESNESHFMEENSSNQNESKVDDMSFQMTSSRLSDLVELPMEILQSPGI